MCAQSSTVLHGRPFPLRGKAYANIFVHFEPIDHNEMNAAALSENKIVDHEHEYTLNRAASKGSLSVVKALLNDVNRLKLHERDANGWQPIHEAARAGHLEVVKYLIEQGADARSMTLSGETPLWWARESLGEDHPVVRYLAGVVGALDRDDTSRRKQGGGGPTRGEEL
jgi:prolyl 4-hydroxylase